MVGMATTEPVSVPVGLISRLVPWALACVLLVACEGQPVDCVLHLDAAEWVASEADGPPPDEAAWAPAALPDLWSVTRPTFGGSVWYRFVLPPLLPEENPTDQLGVYLPKVAMNAAVFLNGHWLGDGGRFDAPVAQNWNRPLYFPFPRSLLEDHNTLYVRVYAYAHDWGVLYPVEVGPHGVLAPQAERRTCWQVTTAQVASLLALLLALVLGALALGRRNAIYGYWALGSFAYFVHSLSGHLRDIPVSYPAGRWLIHVAFDLQAFFFLLSIHRWAGVRRPTLERALIAVWCLGALLLWGLPASMFLAVANSHHFLTLSLAIYGGTVVWKHRARLGREVRLVGGGLLAVVVVGCHAMLVYLGVLPQDTPRLLTLIAPLMILGFGGVLLAHHIRAARAADSLNDVLRERIAAKEQQLRAHFDRIQKLEAERLLAGERARLMQEMHDGMGGELVSLLSTLEGGQAAPQVLRTKVHGLLDEMRVIVDSLDPDIEEIGVLLGMLRERLEPGLVAQGITLRWRVGVLPEAHRLRPEEALDLLRILQEALTNVIKHAKANSVELATEMQGEAGSEVLLLTIRDDGVGVGAAAGHGRGRENMQARAARLGATLTIEDAEPEPGTVVKLRLPVASGPD